MRCHAPVAVPWAVVVGAAVTALAAAVVAVVTRNPLA